MKGERQKGRRNEQKQKKKEKKKIVTGDALKKGLVHSTWKWQ